jgi:hypothetical protein
MLYKIIYFSSENCGVTSDRSLVRSIKYPTKYFHQIFLFIQKSTFSSIFTYKVSAKTPLQKIVALIIALFEERKVFVALRAVTKKEKNFNLKKKLRFP